MNGLRGVGGIGQTMHTTTAGFGGQRSDPTRMAEELFSKLDTAGRGYIDKADLQAAFDKIAGSGSASDSSPMSSAELFAVLDADNDGKVVKQDFVDTLVALRDQGGPQGRGGPGGPGGPGGQRCPQPPVQASQVEALMDNLVGRDSSRGTRLSTKA